MKSPIVVAAVLGVFVGSARAADGPQPAEIRSHMMFLADDLLEGRDAGSRGEAISGLYIAAHFEALGLEPAGVDGAFFQPFGLAASRLSREGFAFEIDGPSGPAPFQNGEDIIVYASSEAPEEAVSAEVVFAGYGVSAPLLDMDDYDDLDAKGKFVAVLGGPPPYMPAAEAAHYGSTATKTAAALEAGAVGLLTVWTPAMEAQFAFDGRKQYLYREFLKWTALDPQAEAGRDGNRLTSKLPSTYVRGAAAAKLFEGAPMTGEEAVTAGAKGPVAGFDLETSVSLQRRTAFFEKAPSRNVAALLPGSDPELADEYVVLTAHYDHVGVCRPLAEDDKICNGALDNAIGTSMLLEVARTLAKAKKRPKRSILFLAVGAEEKGLLGSDYFGNFPTVPRERIVANINLDGALPFYKFVDVIAFGAEQSEMGERLAAAIRPLGMTVAPDPFPEQSIFTRSDQYSFVKAGVPALFLYMGFTDPNGENVGRGWWDRTLATLYHQPTDDLSSPIDYEVAAQFTDVFRRVTLETTNRRQRPRWYAESVFGAAFAPDDPKAESP
ncbi:MAG: M28 family peptidase [Pseudomonadota bacterium]